jgi:monoamine oxidase
MPQTDVAIVGGGAAGLAAARTLTRAGLRCELFEAAPLLGGRVRTLRLPEWQLPIELGAEFVHGRPAPTLALGHGDLGLLHVPERRMLGGTDPRIMPNLWQRFAEAMRAALAGSAQHSVAEYLEEQRASDDTRELVRQVVEGYHGAPLGDVNAQSIARDAARAAKSEQYRTTDGYDEVIRALERALVVQRCRLELNARVTKLEWRPGQVALTVETAGERRELTAARALVTCSLGVLQASAAGIGIGFLPQPESFATALPQLAMGYALRVVLRFGRAPWPKPKAGVEASFVHRPDAPFETFWIHYRAGQEQVVAWAGGPKAAQLSLLNEADRTHLALRSLAQAASRPLDECRGQLIAAHCHDFIADPLFMGAYSYVRPHGGDAARTLAEPCADTLFFAGEALDLEYPGTVAGALGSGEHGARKILATWRA